MYSQPKKKKNNLLKNSEKNNETNSQNNLTEEIKTSELWKYLKLNSNFYLFIFVEIEEFLQIIIINYYYM